MRIILPLIIISFLSACVPASPSHSGNGQHRTTISDEKREVTIQDQSDSKEITFSVKEKGGTFTDYGISHTKQMHLIIIRDDLRYFHHLHPERDSTNSWHVPFTAPAGGTYWLYADFVDNKGTNYVMRFDRKYPGEEKQKGIVKDANMTKNIENVRITLDTVMGNSETTFIYKITDRSGKPVKLEEYLGAKGHSILLSPSGDLIHTHPEEGKGNPIFKTHIPKETFYRIFTQFQIAGKVTTVNFDWERP